MSLPTLDTTLQRKRIKAQGHTADMWRAPTLPRTQGTAAGAPGSEGGVVCGGMRHPARGGFLEEAGLQEQRAGERSARGWGPMGVQDRPGVLVWAAGGQAPASAPWSVNPTKGEARGPVCVSLTVQGLLA